jgi:uncharacterized protein
MLRIFFIGVGVGLLAGLFGKGGSAIATPLLQLAGVPAFFAVASPLPATIPGTLVASLAYVRAGLYDRAVVAATILAGVPACLLGGWLSEWVGGRPLLLASDALVVALGLSFLLSPMASREDAAVPARAARAATIGVGVGLLSGLLANSGGFLFAPLYARVLRMPLKTAFACSLVASAALAIPGTLVHAGLGHISWRVVFALGAGSVPLSYAGARLAVRTSPARLEKVFAVVLMALGTLGLLRA